MAMPSLQPELFQQLNRGESPDSDDDPAAYLPPAPPNHTRIYMLVRQTTADYGFDGMKTTYRLPPDQTPLDPLYRWSESMSTALATIWAGVLQVTDKSCKILVCDLQIGNHFKEVIRKDAFEVYTSLADCKEGSFDWGGGAFEYEGGMDRVSASLSVKEWVKSGGEERRYVDWSVTHVDVPTLPGGLTGTA